MRAYTVLPIFLLVSFTVAFTPFAVAQAFDPSGTWIGPQGGRLVITRVEGGIRAHHRPSGERHFAARKAAGVFETATVRAQRVYFTRYNFVGNGQLRVVRVYGNGEKDARIFKRG